MATISVNSTQSLLAALGHAGNGDIVQLAAGQYSGVQIRDLQISGNVTITSADPSNPAVLHDLVVRNSSGLTFQNLEFSEIISGKQNGFQILGSNNIALDHLNVHGLANLGSGVESDVLMLRSSQNVTVTNSEFYNARNGVSMLDNTGVKIADNYFHDIRTDGVRGGGNSDLVVSRNMFTNFYPATGDHPDAIQLWTTNTTTTASNIAISDNIFVRGSGAPVQGVFIRDTFSQLPFANVSVTGNYIAGGLYNGIAVNGVSSGVIANNVVAGFPDQRSWLRVDNSPTVAVTNNESTFYLIPAANAALATGNSTLATPVDGGAALAQMWLASHSGLGSTWAADTSAVMAMLHLSTSAIAVSPAPIPFTPSSTTKGTDAVTTTPTSDTAPAATSAPKIITVPATTDTATGGTTDSAPSSTVSPTTLQIINGTNANDRLAGIESANSQVFGGNGNDVLTGVSHGHAELIGGAGDDTYVLKSASDIVTEAAGQGTDTVYADFDYILGANVENLRMGTGAIQGTGNDLDNRIIGSDDNNIIYGLGGNDRLQGGGGDDVIYGGDGNDIIYGDDGNDILWGDAGNDLIIGGAGNDRLHGGDGNDILEGGAGVDWMEGGAGRDIFRFRPGDLTAGAPETIADFQRGFDKVALNLMDANINTANTNEAFRFIATSAFHHVAGELRYSVINGDAHVYGDVNGDGIADFELVLQHVTKLSNTDFML